MPDGPHWTGPWASSYAHVDAGFSTFLNNCVEASWFVDDVNGDSRKDTTDKIFEKVKEKSVVWQFDGHLRAIQYHPNRVPNALLRGSVWEKKTCLYEDGFYRLNVEEIERAVARGKHFVFEAGQRGPFSQVWVMPKRRVTTPSVCSSMLTCCLLRLWRIVWFITPR